jgi:hypothetical protein
MWHLHLPCCFGKVERAVVRNCIVPLPASVAGRQTTSDWFKSKITIQVWFPFESDPATILQVIDQQYSHTGTVSGFK